MIFILVLIFPSLTLAESRSAKYFEIGKTSGAPVYIQKTKVESSGDKRIFISVVEDQTGQVQMSERAVLEKGKILEQTIEHFQANEAYELEVKEKEAVFRTFKLVNGKRGEMVGEETRRRPAEFVTGPATEPFLKNSLAKLQSGATVYSHFGIFEIEDFMGMKFKKAQKPAADGSLAVEMRASNFFIGMVFDPIRMELDPQNLNLKRYIGRTPLLRISNGRLKPWDAEIHYTSWQD